MDPVVECDTTLLVLSQRFYGFVHRLPTLKAFAMDNRRSALIVLLFGDPHLLERGQRGQDRTTDPDGVFALWRCNDFNLHGRWCECRDFLLHPVRNTRIHGSTTGLDNY